MTMKLSEVFAQLSLGELSQMSIGGQKAGVINEANNRLIANHIVLGLTTLYTRFNLKEADVVISLKDGRLVYPINSKYAVNGRGSYEPVRWVEDTVSAPFLNDILKIERAFSDAGHEYTLNDQSDKYSLQTPSLDTLRVPAAIVNGTPGTPLELQTENIRVRYRANHPPVVPRAGYYNPDRVTLELPASHLQALLYFVASRAHNPVGMSQEFNAGNNYMARFEQECAMLGFEGLEVNQGINNTRAARAGFV